jgi:hypothetical protein
MENTMQHDKSSFLDCARRTLALGVLAAMCATAFADPAPWYYWRSKITHDRVCAQFSPGNGWVQDGGPYKDARCAARY